MDMKYSPAFLVDGSSLRCFEENCVQSEKVLMGVRHVSRPHYGLQVRSACSTIFCIKFLSFIIY